MAIAFSRLVMGATCEVSAGRRSAFDSLDGEWEGGQVEPILMQAKNISVEHVSLSQSLSRSAFGPSRYSEISRYSEMIVIMLSLGTWG